MRTSLMPPARDHHNYSFFGKARKDAFNGVKALSAKVGSGGTQFTDKSQRQAHQRALLEARLNTYVDTLHTPHMWRRKYLGAAEAPYLKLKLPKLRDINPPARIMGRDSPFKQSIDQRKAASRLVDDFVRADVEVRDDLRKQLKNYANNADTESARDKLDRLHEKLEKHKTFADFETLTWESKYGPAQASTKGRKLERKIEEINAPSSYELHRAAAGGKKVQNKSLYATSLRDIKRGSYRAPAQPTEQAEQAFDKFSSALETLRNQPNKDVATDDLLDAIEEMRRNNLEIEASHVLRPIANHVSAFGLPRKFGGKLEKSMRALAASHVDKHFDNLADAIRAYQSCPSSPRRKKKLDRAALQILRSLERRVLHRFIRTMAKQLRKIADGNTRLQERLTELEELIPDKPSGMNKLAHVLFRHTGYQLRLEDEAQRMLQALPALLDMTREHATILSTNLMSFDCREVEGILDKLFDGGSDLSEASRSFLGSKRGDEFVAALSNKLFEEEIEHDARGLQHRSDANKRIDILDAVKDRAGFRRVFREAVEEVEHLFMTTSDREFWHREAIDKIATPLPVRNKRQPGLLAEEHRRFKQMRLRAAALGINDQTVRIYMRQGIANTLKSRSMAIEGTRIGGVVGSFAGNVLSTPLSSYLASYSPLFLIPGSLDAVLMPAGWLLGLAPGAMVGKFVLDRKKQKRLEETGSRRAVRPMAYPVGETETETDTETDTDTDTEAGKRQARSYADTYKSRSKRYKLSFSAGLDGRPVIKPVSEAIAISRRRQFLQVHGQQFKAMGMEIYTPAKSVLKYIAFGGWRDFKADVVHHYDARDAVSRPFNPAGQASTSAGVSGA